MTSEEKPEMEDFERKQTLVLKEKYCGKYWGEMSKFSTVI
jgi:hypothetical protein